MNADELITESEYIDLTNYTEKLELEINRLEKALEEFRLKWKN